MSERAWAVVEGTGQGHSEERRKVAEENGWREVVAENGRKSLWRMDESVVVENFGSTLVEVANLCAWRVGEERALNRSEVRVAGSMRYKCSLRSPSIPPLRKTHGASSSSLVTSLGACML